MRFLHVSDWHLGVRHHDVDRRPDHDKVLAQIERVARENKVTAILHTGDFWDREPQPDTFAYGWEWLQRLAAIAPVVVLAGNHDDPNLFQMMELVNGHRVAAHFIWPRRLIEQREKSIITIPTAGKERLVIACLPYISKAAYARRLLEAPDGQPADSSRATVRYADLMGELVQHMDSWLKAATDSNTDVSVFAAHMHADQAEPSGSERPFTIEADFAVRQTSRHASYVAYGHIHKPQRVPGASVGEYAGSPIPIDFGEHRDTKRIVIVDAVPGRKAQIESIDTEIGRPLAQVQGTLEELREKAQTLRGSLLKVTLLLDQPINDAEQQVREIFEGATVCGRVGLLYRNDAVTPEGAVGAETALEDLFGHFIADRKDIPDPERVRRYFDEVHTQAKTNTNAADAVFPDLVP